MISTPKIYKGPSFGFKSVLAIGANLLLLTVLTESVKIYSGVASAVNVFYYFMYRSEMNYFILNDDRVVIKNQWRWNFKREILYNNIKSAGTSYFPNSGSHLELVTKENKELSFNCSNVGYKKLVLLIDDLQQRIPSLVVVKDKF